MTRGMNKMQRLTFPLEMGMTPESAAGTVLAQLPEEERETARERVVAIIGGYDEQGLYATLVLAQAAEVGRFEGAAGKLEQFLTDNPPPTDSDPTNWREVAKLRNADYLSLGKCCSELGIKGY